MRITVKGKAALGSHQTWRIRCKRHWMFVVACIYMHMFHACMGMIS